MYIHHVWNSPFVLFANLTFTSIISPFSIRIVQGMPEGHFLTRSGKDQNLKTNRDQPATCRLASENDGNGVKRKPPATTFTQALQHNQSFSNSCKIGDIFEKEPTKLLSWRIYISIDFMVNTPLLSWTTGRPKRHPKRKMASHNLVR